MDRRTLGLVVTAATLSLLATDAAVARAAGCPGAGRPPAAASRGQMAGALRCLVNREREHHGLRALDRSALLGRAAHGHAMSMVHGRYFAHAGLRGSSPAQRARAAGYLPSVGRWELGENIASGTHRLATPRSIFAALMASPEHRAILLTAGYHAIGIGVARGTPTAGRTRSGVTYVLDLGARH